MRAAVVLFTRDLRLHDNPALTAAVYQAESVLPLFVLDDAIGAARYGRAANRHTFLLESLADLDASLRERGAGLEVRRGDVVEETVRAAREVGTTTVFASADVSSYARERERRLGQALDLRLENGSFVVPAGEVAPAGSDHYQVFTPYHRAWSAVPFGDLTARPPGDPPAGPPAAAGPAQATLVVNHHKPGSPDALPGGETAGVKRARLWLQTHLDGYGAGGHDDLAADATSRLSPYLHFGCVSPRALAVRGPCARRRGVHAAALLARLLRPVAARAPRQPAGRPEDPGATAGSTTPTRSQPGRRG